MKCYNCGHESETEVCEDCQAEDAALVKDKWDKVTEREEREK